MDILIPNHYRLTPMVMVYTTGCAGSRGIRNQAYRLIAKGWLAVTTFHLTHPSKSGQRTCSVEAVTTMMKLAWHRRYGWTLTEIQTQNSLSHSVNGCGHLMERTAPLQKSQMDGHHLWACQIACGLRQRWLIWTMMEH